MEQPFGRYKPYPPGNFQRPGGYGTEVHNDGRLHSARVPRLQHANEYTYGARPFGGRPGQHSPQQIQRNDRPRNSFVEGSQDRLDPQGKDLPVSTNEQLVEPLHSSPPPPPGDASKSETLENQPDAASQVPGISQDKTDKTQSATKTSHQGVNSSDVIDISSPDEVRSMIFWSTKNDPNID